MTAIKQILDAYREGHGALLISGRSIYDFVKDDDKIRPLFEALRRALYQEYGMVFITYSLANGINLFENWIADDADRQTVRGALNASGLIGASADNNDAVAVIRSVAALLRTGTENLKWKDGRPMRLAICLEFSEHLAPCVPPGSQTDPQLVFTELVYIMSQSLALRDSGNLVLFQGRSDQMDELVRGSVKNVYLPQPAESEKSEFLSAAIEFYDKAAFEEGLTREGVIALSVNTPNRSIENILRASHRSGRPVTTLEIAEQKGRDVELLSEGTLTPLDTRRVAGLNLVGRNIQVPQKIIRRFSSLLLKRDPTMPANVLLGGAPATGKTDLALLAAYQGECPAYQMHSPKGGIVGETERKARRQQEALKEWVPNVAFCDEITEAMPLERGEFNGDSGASRAVTAQLLTALSDETRRGRSLLIATTNRIWAMGDAMRSRFIVIPVLSPLEEDYPQILLALAKRITPECEIDPESQKIKEAAACFYAKGANPRRMRSALSNALILSERSVLDVNSILFAAHDLCPASDTASGMYADLQAIRYCTSMSFLPWSGTDDYKFPHYLKGIVNESNGEIDISALERKIDELKAHANV